MEMVKEKRSFALLKGSLVALTFTLFAILVFAVIMKFAEINDGFIMPINQVIKVLSILFGVSVMFKQNREKGLIRGALLGFVYTLLSYIVFSLISRSFIFDFSVITDLVFGCIMGAICGAIIVNRKK